MQNNNPGVVVRDAAQSDAKAIFIIRANARRLVYKDFLSAKSWRSFEVQNAVNDQTLAHWNNKVAEYLTQKDMYIFRVATINRVVVGWSLSDIRKDQVHLMRLFVDPNIQSNGIGGKLLSDLYGFVGNRRITLTVLEPNLPAINFYKKYGFAHVGDAGYKYLSIPCIKMQKLPPHLDKTTL